MADKNYRATIVSFDNVGSSGLFRFRCDNGVYYAMLSYQHGILEILPACGTKIDDLAHAIAGCFVEGSNLYGVKQIDFEFDGVSYSITAENASVDEIVGAWERVII